MEVRAVNAELANCDGLQKKIVTLEEALKKANDNYYLGRKTIGKLKGQIDVLEKSKAKVQKAYYEQVEATKSCKEDVKKEKRKGNAKGWGFGVGCGTVGAGIGLLVGIFAVK